MATNTYNKDLEECPCCGGTRYYNPKLPCCVECGYPDNGWKQKPDEAERVMDFIPIAGFVPTHVHKKGGQYRLLGFGKHTETQEKLAIYQDRYGRLHARPRAMFEDGRFTPIVEAEIREPASLPHLPN